MVDDNSVERRIQLINEEVERKNREAVELLEYLNVQRLSAKELEDLEEEELKRRGIIIGQHIPSLKSRLDLDHDKLSEFGDFSSTLLIARDLVEQNHTNFLRRTGNLPISDIAEAKKLKYEQSMIGVDTDSPHYLTKTHNTNVRTERVAVRFAETLHTREVERTKFLEASKSLESGDQLNSKKKFKKKIMLSAIQREENENILKGINHKLNYLRNPRNDPKSITKMLVKPASFYDGVHQQQQQPLASHEEGHDPDDHSLHSELHSDSHSKVNQKGSVAGSHGHGGAAGVAGGGSLHQSSVMEASMGSSVSKAKSKFGKQHFTLDNNPLFVSEPTLVNFTNYEIGKKYTQNFSFRNVSAVTRSVRIIPPANKVFAITPLKYPTNSVAGMVAPGMCVMTTLSFNPTSLGDYSGYLRVETESGNFKVQIHAQREPPYLSIPNCLNVGNCLVGDASRVSITCLNSGGAGKFTLLTEDQYLVEKPDVEIDYGSLGCMRLPPFTFYPTEFSLVRNESTELNIEFVPLSVDTFEYPFYMKCDNGTYRKFTVKGISRDLNVTLAEINNVEFESQDSTQYSDMVFPAANIDSEQSQQVMVVNETGLAVEYEWVWMPLSVRDMHSCGQDAIRAREIASSKEHGFNLTEPDLPPSPPAHGEEHGAEHRVTTSDQKVFGTMVKSMNMTREEEDGDSQMSTNRAVSEQFEIHPARGVMPHDGAESFTVSFTPSELQTVSMRAVLMIKAIPKAALPGVTQQGCLDKLLEHGHGPFTRLKSWLEEIGTPATVDEYVKPNGDSTDSTKLISLSTIVSLIISQTINGVDPNCSIVLDDMYYARINQWIRKAITHMYNFRKAAVLDDESSVESGDEEEGAEHSAEEHEAAAHHKHVHLEVFDWKHTVDEVPTLMYPMKVNHEFVPEPPKSAKPKQEGVIEEEEVPVGQTLHEFTNEERQQLSEIWMDVKHTLLLLGHDMCDMLNDKVKHEAIDFLKDCTLNHYCGLNFGVYGEGCRQYVLSSPSELNIGGPLSIGKEWTGEFKLVNTSNTMAEIEIDIARSVLKKCASSLHVTAIDDISGANETISDSFRDTTFSEQYTISTDVTRILLMPMSDQTILITVKINLTGKFEIVLPFKPKSHLTIVEPLILVADVIGPRLKFQAFEVDMGLVGVGGEVSKTLTFTNEGDVPLMFMMRPTLHVDISAKPSKDDKALMPNSARTIGSKDTGTGRLNSQRSMSRSNTSRSDDYSVANSEASEGSTFKIELKNAVCVIDPPSGVVGAMQPYTVNITCKAGKIGQRIRGMIETRVFDMSGKIEILSQFLNMRGEVQAPKTKMYPLNFNLGQVYIGMPVKFTVTVENICNLPTKYKLMRPGGDTALYQLTYDKEKGPLGPKEIVNIECTFIALTPGLIDDTIANKIFGSQVPLGFCFKAVAKGIMLDFQNLLENEPLPTPLAGPEETQFPGSDKPPEPSAIMPLELGDSVDLYERKWTRFAIRNLSAIPATYELKAKSYPVIEKTKKSSVASVTVESSVVSLNAPERTDLFLASHETGADKFQSESGKKYITVTLQRQEDRKFLKSGLGASYLIENTSGVIPPWGVQEVIVRAFNDIPGKYNDDIECSLFEGEIVRKFNLPIKMNIVGCPVTIEKDTLGMTTVHREPASLIGKTLLQLGHACVNCEPLVREFYLRNNGSKNGKVKWNVKGLAQKTNGPIKFSYTVSSRGVVKSVLRFWEDITKDSPFKVEPENATIPPYGKTKFKVTLFRTENIGKEYAELSGKVTFSEDILSSASVDDASSVPDDIAAPPSAHQGVGGLERKNSMSSVNSMRSKSSSMANLLKPTKFTLSLILEGDFVHPTVVVDKNIMVASQQITTAPDLCGVLLKGQSTILFARDAKPAELCYKSLTIVNPLDALLSFTLTTMGPFQLKDAVDENVVISKKDLLAVTNKQQNMTTAPVQHGPGANSRIFSLLPNRSGSIVVAFNPKKDVRDTLIRSFGTEAGKPTEQRGKLIFTYSTGQTLQVPIINKISTPFIGGSCPRMYFGVCHTSQTCQGLYLMTNPTDVPASWTVEHIVGGGAWKKGTAIKVPGFEPKYIEVDDPSVFEISPRNGVVMGPTVSVTAAVAAPPKDFNRFVETIVPQRTVESSWASSTMTMKDSLEVKHHDQHQSEADACFPMPLTIRFLPSKKAHYSSRFRFTCEYGNSFELVLQGEGTYEEHEHKPLNPIPK